MSAALHNFAACLKEAESEPTLINPPPGAVLLCRKAEGPFRKGERWELSVIEAHQTLGLSCAGRNMVELGCKQLSRLMKDGAFEVFDPSITDRDRQLVALKLAAPMRAAAGKVIASQSDAAHLPLFIEANEPRLI